MKKIVVIVWLFAFGNYIFTYKTHYCFFPDGQRFYGDCEPGYHQQIKKYVTLGKLPPESIFPDPFHCVEFQKDSLLYKQSLPSVLPHIDFGGLPSYCIFNFVPPLRVIAFIPLPVFSCRGDPPLHPNILRGPPLV
ncbi:MAG: hypothetical protein ACRDE2_03705 [Chitinophagaceae bacterium]